MLIVNKEVMQIIVNRIGSTIVYNYEGRLLKPFRGVVVREDDEEEERKEPYKFVNYYINYY